MCLAQGHNAVPPVRLKPATPRARVKLSITESQVNLFYKIINMELKEKLLSRHPLCYIKL